MHLVNQSKQINIAPYLSIESEACDAAIAKTQISSLFNGHHFHYRCMLCCVARETETLSASLYLSPQHTMQCNAQQ